MNKPCDHLAFTSSVNVYRLTDDDDGGPVTGFAADLKICCAICGMSMQFLGAERGLSPYKPMTSVDRLEMRLPITPLEER